MCRFGLLLYELGPRQYSKAPLVFTYIKLIHIYYRSLHYIFINICCFDFNRSFKTPGFSWTYGAISRIKMSCWGKINENKNDNSSYLCVFSFLFCFIWNHVKPFCGILGRLRRPFSDWELLSTMKQNWKSLETCLHTSPSWVAGQKQPDLMFNVQKMPVWRINTKTNH